MDHEPNIIFGFKNWVEKVPLEIIWATCHFGSPSLNWLVIQGQGREEGDPMTKFWYSLKSFHPRGNGNKIVNNVK
jgi:hypothetical protein